MDIILLIAAFIYFVLVVIAVVTVIGLPEHLEKIRAEIAKNSKMLEGMGSNLDAIRNQLADTKNVVSQVKDIQSSKLERLDRLDRLAKLERLEKAAAADTVVESRPPPQKKPDAPMPSVAAKAPTMEEPVREPEQQKEAAPPKIQSVWRYKPHKEPPPDSAST